MPDEMSVAEIVTSVGAEWADRVTVSKLLKAFGIEPCGKKRGPDGGRPAIMYPAESVTKLIALVSERRGTF